VIRRRGPGTSLLLGALVISAAVPMIAACQRPSEGTSGADASPVSSISSAAAAPSAAVPAPPADRWSEAGMLAEAALYLDSADFRRATLLESLTNPKNTYSRQRLDAYALKTKGWDLLPAWNPQSIAVTTAMAGDLRAQRELAIPQGAAPLWDGKRPTTMAEWIKLGQDVFEGYPLRSEITLRWALENGAVGERVGVRPNEAGVYPGVRLFTNVDGKTVLGITCAMCHTSVDSRGAATKGEARRSFDYGALRSAYHKATNTFVDPDLLRRMHTWGPGRADVTEDDDEDPVAIPDLWGLRHQSVLTQAGTIKHVGPTALAIRQETQILHSNHQKIRPPRELAWALAMYLYSLEPPPRAASAPAPDSKAVAHGQELFGKQCKKCHSNQALGGPAAPAELIGTDRSLATGGARGTGKYRPPALIRVSAAAPYFHHGAVPTLEDVLSPARLEPTYTKGSLAKGAVPGHVYGTDLPAEDRLAIVAYLRTL